MRLAKIKKTYLVAAAALGVGAMICLPRFASAAVTGQCNVCHTMHNSQNGQPMTYNDNGTTSPVGSATPNDTLLRGNCLQCHTGLNNGSNARPYVYTTAADGAVLYGAGTAGNTLAGGNFYWTVNGGGTAGGVDAVDQYGGHNVDMLGGASGNALTAGPLTSPPGDSDGTSWAARVGNQTDMRSGGHLTCAGTAGCHGDRGVTGTTDNFTAVHGAHHAKNTDFTRDGTTVGTSFRFLLGVKGTEDPTWEYQATGSTNHNEYYGLNRTASDAADDTIPTLSGGTNSTFISISQLCAECHGAFHNSSGTYTGTQGIQGSGATMASPWIRHPTDFNMDGLGGEYANYTAYDPMVPIGHSTLTGLINGTVAYEGTTSTNGDIVMCISCHRAHGSPYADLLRWKYSQMKVGTTGAGQGHGCFKCHSTKDGP